MTSLESHSVWSHFDSKLHGTAKLESSAISEAPSQGEPAKIKKKKLP
jgi:hypothetical protein